MASITHIIRRRRSRKARRQAAQTRNRMWTVLIGLTLTLAVILPVGIVLGGAAFLYLRATSELPTPAESTLLDPIIGPTQLFDRDGGRLLFSVQDPLGDQRAWMSLDDLPPYVVAATLLAEDEDFLQTARFDPVQTIGKLWGYILDRPPRADSSLTARLVRNAVMPRVTGTGLEAQALEIALTAEINRLYTPEEILECISIPTTMAMMPMA